ncbi:hypothetical protein [Krasilnikovia sp. M28-CT-15]|uniref:hypothetical protein n=1 Tax=Krasilnikovia sp. M28-CT-15 TaxID=3373540 RepID=UPI00399D093B
MRNETADPLAERLVATLERRAGAVDDGPRFGAADVVRAGNRRIRRRRATVAATAAAVVAATLTGSLIARPSASPPSHPATSPAPSTSAVRMDLLSRNTVFRADGSRVALGLPGGRSAKDAVRVRAGWVVTAQPVSGGKTEVWFVPDHGTARSAGTVFGGVAVSPDNRVLVVAHDASHVGAYELPSLREIRRQTFEEGMGPGVLGATDDVALLDGGSGDGTPMRGAVWNFRTGSFTTTRADIPAWGMSDDGQVLRRIGDCVDVVPVTVTVPSMHQGWCPTHGPVEGRSGTISPDGRWASLDVRSADEQAEPTTVLLRTADLKAGRWRPVPTGGPADAHPIWLTGDVFVLEMPQGGRLWCRAGDRCQPVVEPPGLSEPTLVMLRGIR